MSGANEALAHYVQRTAEVNIIIAVHDKFHSIFAIIFMDFIYFSLVIYLHIYQFV